MLNLHKTVLNRILDYLQIKGDKQGQYAVYSQQDIEKIKEFLNENPNTRVFFQKQTFLKKYGVSNPLQDEKIRDSMRQTIREKYGVDNVSKSDCIKDKKRKTLQKHYGDNVTNPMSCEDIRQKVIENWKSKTEEEKKELQDKKNITMLSLYGTVNPYDIPFIKKKAIETRKNNKYKERITLEEKYGKLLDIKEICMIFQKSKDYIYSLIGLLNIDVLTIKDSIFLTKDGSNILEKYFNKTSRKGVSNKEENLRDFIRSIYKGTIILNDRSVLNPYELDIYLPERNISFEFDGIYYHSNVFKDKWYHYNKTKQCSEKGIRLIHVFEDDWILRQPIVKSMIKSSLGIYEQKIYARKCVIKEIDFSTYKVFMDNNHLQGAVSATYYLGLFYNDKLVQCISFIKNGINNTWELNRMATVLNTQVIGGFSKLIQYGVRKLHIEEFVSYVFKAWFDGKGYERCGLKFDYECPPVYWYIVKGEKTNRINFKKSNIERKVRNGELSYFNRNDTEQDNMAKNGYTWIWDCGKIRMRYKDIGL